MLEGSNTFEAGSSTNIWTTLHDSDQGSGVIFSSRSKEETFFSFINDQQYKHYAITFVRKPDSSKIQIGNYGIVEAYTRQCTLELFKELTGILIAPAYITSAPTGAPTKASSVAPFNSSTLKAAVDLWVSNRTAAMEEYGDIKHWSTDRVASMRELFSGKSSFNDDISLWDTSSVTSMRNMFYFATEFNSDISQWNTGSVANMANMFSTARDFNSDLSQWSTGSVNNMYRMFYRASTFNSDISQWNTGYVTSMYNMFQFTNSFNSDLSLWNIGSVTTMVQMFYHAKSFGYDLCWDLSGVGGDSIMFDGSSGSADC